MQNQDDEYTFDKIGFLQNAKKAISDGFLTEKDLQELFTKNKQKSALEGFDFMKVFVKFLAGVGALLAILGVLFFVVLVWNDLGDFGQIIITLGLGIASFIGGCVLLKTLPQRFVGLSLHGLAFVTIPAGVFTSLSKMPAGEADFSLVVFFVFSILTAIYLATDIFLRSNFFTVATILLGSVAYWSGIFIILENTRLWEISEFSLILYALPLIIPSRFAAKTLREKSLRFFEGIGWFSGMIGVWILFYNSPFQIITAILYLWAILLAIKVKSFTLLVIAFTVLTCFILYINMYYFSGFIGWPLALIGSGGVLVASGYLLAKNIKKLQTKLLLPSHP